MRATTVIGILLILIGAIGVLFGGISYTTRETVIDAGPIKASADTRKTMPISPVLGGVLLVSGAVLLFSGTRRVP
ncbi:MAG: DUF3185 domain-containing protein [Verrucomicrobiota bacterium]|nr:DUF3185 domain-containing protein [Verrucomicrobiota bacterium]